MTTPKTDNSNERESAAQMCEERQCYQKAGYLLAGAIKREMEQKGYATEIAAYRSAAHLLAMIVEDLTSADKKQRAYGKDDVRELTKLGEEE